jgi:hypothetical protein
VTTSTTTMLAAVKPLLGLPGGARFGFKGRDTILAPVLPLSEDYRRLHGAEVREIKHITIATRRIG